MIRRTLALATTALVMLPTLALAAGSKTSGPSGDAVGHDMLVWFGSHPGVTYALAIGTVAFAVGMILNRE